MTYHKSFRQCIQKDDNELLIFGADNFSQFPRRNASVSSKCDRALAIACKDDLVVLRTSLDHEYQEWLLSHGLGSDYVVEYKVQSREKTLSELIVNDPEPIKKIIKKINRKPVYVPWFSGYMENEAAKVLGADLFGASESATIKYIDKASFKSICQQLDIPVVKGSSFEFYPDENENYLQFEKIINHYLSTSKIVIIRGTLGEAGMSLYKTHGNDIAKLYRQITKSSEKVVIIEPFLNVSSSPTDQWVINREGNINHLGMRQQICERGMVHVGTLKGEKTPKTVLDYISKISVKIVTHMARSGYQGVVGIDYIVTDNGIFPIENNARFNGSSYVSMIIDNIEEKLKAPIPYWKFIKIKTSACSFLELTKRMESILYDAKKSNCVFPYNCNSLSTSGSFAVVLLAKNLDQIVFLEKSLNEMGIKR
ncbi:MAG: hypothetical protein KOO65_01830 [Desulfobacterales bacterium]|nr:hypothetical protein [Desulfobacterales bacterium]